MLGRRVAEQWREYQPGAAVYAVTRSKESAAEVEALGLKPLLSADIKAKPFMHMGAYANVVFCAPPSGNEDYAADVKAACELWNGAGGLVFTSSSGIYAEGAGGDVTEDSALAETERAAKLLACEQHVRKADGCVLRLGGLYTVRRGPQAMFLQREELDMDPSNMVNMVHYTDAASAVVEALKESVADAAEEDQKVRGKVFNIADGEPLTREEICEAALASPVYEGKKVPAFTQERKDTGKRIVAARAKAALPGWTPKYTSFKAAMASIPADSED